ncbi:helix-turn-helix domain-containing protein [Lawsonibacter faecis]|jgi:transcriptional regulator, araC family|uniref:Helix-turn-helix transcriptional regulator n=1 Tax=Lawsonibacter faecis TaxID=2763052 RepID=A0A8J6JI72_9FIRM|nr:MULTISPECIES: helix-turn-helix transcriptional regulator [Oscillospiraceae]KAB4603745.1 helix-turn-helix transcriptional regulator [Bacteroides thetaiotaomicron]MTQ96450.1 helix-turn-helix domain-containing protein [Pseudoflavonifractor sp. BIOML-A16]MTR05840.1 helix-turn-helix domain-containing protein [Pseudoflavonifractor sp. BIOML-A15]MTR31214.1 helix-turn-helix domain-containing protein [Pseudoflavonifractor sp. BIOML-A14]MTR72569.1 helix-turn-helix domain-containing protein [Pseudofla
MKEKKDINIKVGERIKNAREKAGLTQEKFAELLSLSAKNISAIERGAVGISLTTLQKICETLSISSDRILFESPDENSEAELLAGRMKRLAPEQFKIAKDILNKVFEAFALVGK